MGSGPTHCQLNVFLYERHVSSRSIQSTPVSLTILLKRQYLLMHFKKWQNILHVTGSKEVMLKLGRCSRHLPHCQKSGAKCMTYWKVC